MGVTAVALLLLFAAGLLLVRLLASFTMPVVVHEIGMTYQTAAIFVLFSLLGIGLSVTCGVGFLMGRNWARVLYLVAVPALILLSLVMNGFQVMQLIGLIFYVVFAHILTLRESAEYFTRPF